MRQTQGQTLRPEISVRDRRRDDWHSNQSIPRRLIYDSRQGEAGHEVEEITGGWESRAFIVGGVWLEREPLRAQTRTGLLAETRLMPWLARQLPLPVPVPEVVRAEPLRVRHRLIPGLPASMLTDEQGAVLGRFFRALHAIDAQVAATMGIPNAPTAWAAHLRQLDRFGRDVMPRLPGHLLPRAQALLTRLSQPAPTPTLVHADVGPEHILLHDGAVSGVIDWTDARIGDPAVDLAWLLHGSSAGNAVAEAYGATAELFDQASDWHLLGPWHEVIYGIETNQPSFIDSGLQGVTARLKRKATPAPQRDIRIWLRLIGEVHAWREAAKLAESDDLRARANDRADAAFQEAPKLVPDRVLDEVPVPGR